MVQDIASRRLERQSPEPITQAVAHEDWPTNGGTGRHRRSAPAPDLWAACHSLRCAHLQTPHTTTPAGLVCGECGLTIPGGPVHDDIAHHPDEVAEL